jgi:hypothetical protein
MIFFFFLRKSSTTLFLEIVNVNSEKKLRESKTSASKIENKCLNSNGLRHM